MENTHKRRNISQLHQLTEVGACFDGKYFEIQQRLAARVARAPPGWCSTAPRCSGWATKTKLEMNDLRKHETKLWSLEWSQIRFSLNFFPSFFLPQLRCWAAALRPALTHSSEIGINQNSIKVEYPGEKYFEIMLTKKSLLLSNSYF